MMTAETEHLDATVSKAVRIASRRMAGRNAAGERVLERDLDHEVIDALRPLWDGAVLSEGRKRGYPFVGWSPPPGGPDISLYLAGAPRPHAIIECKWSLDGDNLYEFLNDALKLTAAFEWPGFAAGYLLAGAPAALRANPTLCADWFPEAPGAIMCVPLAALLEQHAALWQTIRDRSAGTPPPACAEVELRAVARTQFSIRNGQGVTEAWETRCTRLVPV